MTIVRSRALFGAHEAGGAQRVVCFVQRVLHAVEPRRPFGRAAKIGDALEILRGLLKPAQPQQGRAAAQAVRRKRERRRVAGGERALGRDAALLRIVDEHPDDFEHDVGRVGFLTLAQGAERVEIQNFGGFHYNWELRGERSR